ncbi:MAG: TIM44-like domain-containing protein [Polyangiaceae bacterium]|nr:TIM44-like domain-containing protein [Polyangiaceae bacterium]
MTFVRRHIVRLVFALTLGAFLVGLQLLVSPVAEARPGGGQSFGSGSKSSSGSRSSSGGSRSSSGSSSSWGSSKSSSGSDNWSSKPSYSAPWSGGTKNTTPPPVGPHGSSSGYRYASAGPPNGSVGEFFFWILLGGGALVLVVCGYTWYLHREHDEWASAVLEEGEEEDAAQAEEDERNRRYTSIQEALHAIVAKDENFSFVIFEDFLYALFSEVHTARGNRKPGLLRPYLREDVVRALELRGADAVDAIVVGSMRIEEVRGDAVSHRVSVRVRFVANYTERNEGREQSYYVEEVWKLSKNADAPSRAPDKARTIGCPNCGANLAKELGDKCKYCGTPADSDVHDWIVEEIAVDAREGRGPLLHGTTQEVGTDLPSVVVPDAPVRFEELKARDPAFTWVGFVNRIDATFNTFHKAWSSQDLAPVRPFLSDALFETQRYWVEAYKKQNLRNVTEDARIVTTHIAKVTSDKHYDSITVRVFASCIDYTLDQEDKVVGGSKKKTRDYSEYWTFIRGAKVTGAARSDAACPNCGAPVEKINMAGNCESCSTKVTTGDFDWVLSRIEQDEVYEG